jgi:hypothetical protein
MDLSKIEVVLLVELNVGLAEGCSFEQVGFDGRAAGEELSQLKAEFIDVLFLIGRADHFGGGGKGVGGRDRALDGHVW